MPVPQYIEEVGSLRQSLDDARSEYFHSPRRKVAIRRHTAAVQKAYAASADGADKSES